MIASTVTGVLIHAFIVITLFTKYNGVERSNYRNYDFGMESKKKRPGRPPKPPGETKPGVFQIRLSDDERGEFQYAAERAGLPLAQWMRDRLSKAAKRESKRD